MTLSRRLAPFPFKPSMVSTIRSACSATNFLMSILSFRTVSSLQSTITTICMPRRDSCSNVCKTPRSVASSITCGALIFTRATCTVSSSNAVDFSRIRLEAKAGFLSIAARIGEKKSPRLTPAVLNVVGGTFSGSVSTV